MPISTIGQNGLNAPLSLTTPALGTPSALVLTNATGLPQAGLATGVAGNGPAFFAWRSTAQSITGGTYTRINCQSEVFDTANCYDSTTNYRFTPNVAGYYWFGFSAEIGAPGNRYTAYLYKNGSSYMVGPNMIGNGTNSQACCFYGLAYANGTTDYFEIYIQGNNSATVDGSAYVTYFQGNLVRAA